jgi:hypothetical protein
MPQTLGEEEAVDEIDEVFTVFALHRETGHRQWDIDGDGLGQLALVIANYALMRGAGVDQACEDVLMWLNDPGKKLQGLPQPLVDRVFVDQGRVLVLSLTISRDVYRAVQVPPVYVPR